MAQACEMTGLHPRDLSRAVEEGDLHAYRPRPRRWWFLAEELAAFLRWTMDHPDFWDSANNRLAWRAHNPFRLPSLPISPDDGSDVPNSQGDFFQ